MSSKNLDEIIPLEYHDGFYTTGYSMEYLEDLGLLKDDIIAKINEFIESEEKYYARYKKR